MGEHQVEAISTGGKRCALCERHFEGNAYGDCPGVKQYSWDAWPDGLFTAKQLREKNLIPGPVVGAVYYTNKRLYPAGHWLWLHSEIEALPKPAPTEKQIAAHAKATVTRNQNRTCIYCGKVGRSKIKRDDGLCFQCMKLTDVIETARKWLSLDALIIDVETTGLNFSSSDVIEIAVVDMLGSVLLKTYVQPSQPIIEEPFMIGEDWEVNGTEQPTAFGVNGITNEMVVGAPTLPEIWPCLMGIVQGKTIIAYGAEFDEGMLIGGMQKHHLSKPTWKRWLCARTFYAEVYGEWHDYYRNYRWQSLSHACSVEHVHIDIPSHTAEGDCLRILGLLRAIASKQLPVGRQAAIR